MPTQFRSCFAQAFVAARVALVSRPRSSDCRLDMKRKADVAFDPKAHAARPDAAPPPPTPNQLASALYKYPPKTPPKTPPKSMPFQGVRVSGVLYKAPPLMDLSSLPAHINLLPAQCIRHQIAISRSAVQEIMDHSKHILDWLGAEPPPRHVQPMWRAPWQEMYLQAGDGLNYLQHIEDLVNGAHQLSRELMLEIDNVVSFVRTNYHLLINHQFLHNRAA